MQLPVNDAWIGDAVLSLYARAKILRETGMVDGAKCAQLTSNHFLASFGEPTRVEAEIGRIYQQEGLEAAFHWIEERLLPLYRRQEEKRSRKLPRR